MRSRVKYFAAVPGVVLHLSDAMVKAKKSPTTLELTDHKQHSAKQGCTIL